MQIMQCRRDFLAGLSAAGAAAWLAAVVCLPTTTLRQK